MTGKGAHSHNHNDSSKHHAVSGVLSEELLLYFIKHSPNSAAIFDRNMVYLTCSDQHLRDFGLSKEQVIGNSHYEIFPELRQEFRNAHQRALQGHVVKNNNDRFVLQDGSIRYTSWECLPWYDAEGEIGGMILYSENTTEQIRVLQEAKNQAEQDKKQLEAVLSTMASGVAALDRNGNVIHVNDALARILGYRNHSELLLDYGSFKSLFRLYSYPGRSEIPSDKWPLQRLYHAETVNHEKHVIQRLDTGMERIVEYYGTTIPNEKGEPELVLLMITDITERQQSEEELRKTKEFAEQEQAKWLVILDHVSNGVTVVDASANQIYANNSHRKIYGFEEGEEIRLTSKYITSNFVLQTYPDGNDLSPDEWPAPRLLRGEILDEELLHIRRLDKELDIVVRMSGIPVTNAKGELELGVIVSSDISEQIKAEQQKKIMNERMEQTQRLESLGVLAGGIAHDFNNLLMGILGYADLALLELSQSSPVAVNLERIKTASLRAADLCTQLLAYSGQGKIEEKAFSMSNLVSEMSPMLKTSISKTCVLNLDLEQDLPLTIGDSSQMRQIVMNFVINASESIGDCNGTISISTGSLHCELEYFTDDYMIRPLNPGLYVTLEVSDNGLGMDQETLGRIFEPFYSTKFTGRGLGLSAVLGIIQSHDGGLRVSSEPGIGTTFKVFLPAVHSTASKNLHDVEETDAKGEQFSGRVLLVEDEEIERDLCVDQLEALGLEALTARDGQEGIEIYQEKQDEIDLVLLDLTMPKMGGEETFQILRQLDPKVKVVLAGGYAVEEMTTRFAGEKPSGYLRKPYTLKQLSSALSDLLAQGR